MEAYPRLSWESHLQNLQWRQGEHVLICAPTGHGKTYLASEIVGKRGHTVVLTGKTRDDDMAGFFDSFTRFAEWRTPKPYEDKVLLWPKPQPTLRGDKQHLREVFGEALDAIWQQGNRCVVIDEALQFSENRELNLGSELAHLMQQGRSAGLSVVVLSQRPAWIPKIVYSSVSHGYVCRTRDRADLFRLSDFAGTDSNTLRWNVASLPNRFDYVYTNPHGDSPSVIVNTHNTGLRREG